MLKINTEKITFGYDFFPKRARVVAPRKEEDPNLHDDWVSAVDGSSSRFFLTGCYDGSGSLDVGDSIVVAKSFSHVLNLANLAEEVQISRRRRNKVKKGNFADETNATSELDIEETLKRLVFDLKKSPQEVFDALKNPTVEKVKDITLAPSVGKINFIPRNTTMSEAQPDQKRRREHPGRIPSTEDLRSHLEANRAARSPPSHPPHPPL
ncbi:hypothetical protein RIF29_04142 [Crotalaria pallida]|uniref:Uncharacterized protein n=1 Tax=Crotalaria pallida TaxID=3830 RepID=A0AAN9P928_CROPI